MQCPLPFYLHCQFPAYTAVHRDSSLEQAERAVLVGVFTVTVSEHTALLACIDARVSAAWSLMCKHCLYVAFVQVPHNLVCLWKIVWTVPDETAAGARVPDICRVLPD